MKRILLLLLSLTLLFSISASAWADENTFYYLGGSGIFEYERSLTEDISLSIGVTPLAIYVNDENNNKSGFSLFQFSVGFRKYFDTTEPQNGFYLNGFVSNLSLNVTTTNYYDYEYERDEVNFSAFGGGIIAGNRFNARNGFTFDLGLGLIALSIDTDPETAENLSLNSSFYILPIGRMAFGYTW